MKFIITTRHADGGESWEEEYDKSRINLEDDIGVDRAKLSRFSNKRIADLWGREIIKYFNRTEKGPNPGYRVYVGSRLIDEAQAGPDHSWRKSNLVTIMGGKGGMFHDTYKCQNCGITSKRFGLGENYVLDPKYKKAAVYLRCDTAKAHLDKKARK